MLTNYEAAAGGNTAVENKGGFTGDNEGKLDMLAKDFAMTAEEAQAMFKDGNPLTKSAVTLDFAANKLIDAAKALHPGG